MSDVYARPAPNPRDFASYGDGSWIVPPCEVVGADLMSIGRDVIVLEHGCLRALPTGASPGARLVLRDRVRLGRFVTIVCGVEVVLEEDVSSSDFIAIRDTWDDIAIPVGGPGGLGAPVPQPVHVGRGAYLGYGCVLHPGVSIGRGAFVGEGAIVTEDVDPFTVVYGNPAVRVRSYDASTKTWAGSRWP